MCHFQLWSQKVEYRYFKNKLTEKFIQNKAKGKAHYSLKQNQLFSVSNKLTTKDNNRRAKNFISLFIMNMYILFLVKSCFYGEFVLFQVSVRWHPRR